jgi:putative ABC transport system permease protein
MKLSRLVFCNLKFYWRTNIVIIAGVAAAISVLSGAMLVGQSVRESLRHLLYERIGSTEYVISAEQYFSDSLADAFSAENSVCPIIHLKGILTHGQTEIRAHDVNVYGVDERFWKFHNVAGREFQDDRSVLIGSPLAGQLNAGVGDSLLLKMEIPQAIPREWLYGQRENFAKTLRLTCSEILPANKLGEFSLRPGQGSIYSIFVSLKFLQKELAQSSHVNKILLAGRETTGKPDHISASLDKHCSLEDFGLRLNALPTGKGFALESRKIILDDSIAAAAARTTAGLGLKSVPIFTYLANFIRAKGRSIPYSVITAADLGNEALGSISFLDGSSVKASERDLKNSIWLTDWARRDLGISREDAVEIDYYLWRENGLLETQTARFQLAGVLANEGDVNSALAPEIPGITDSRSISSWDPPFPLDLRRIRPEDEDYWNRYRATPKAFISLARGQELWQNRFGKQTSIRILLPKGADLASSQGRFARALLEQLNPLQSGFSIHPVREQGLAASRGSTDFGEYFIYFSSFLIAAAILLSSLFFKLMTEQRVHEIGILLASGFPIKILRRIFLLESTFLIAIGSVIGVFGSIGYGRSMMSGLSTVWQDAVGTQRLLFHLSYIDLFLGVICGVLFSFLAILWTLRDLQRNSPRSLLAGVLESIAVRRKRARILSIISILAVFAAGLMLTCFTFGIISELPGFFGAGFLLLVSILCGTAVYLRRTHPSPIQGNGWTAYLRLVVRNSTHRPGRSLLCASLIASATFIIVSMEAFRQDEHSTSAGTQSGTGGFAFIGQSDLPFIHDLNSNEGREVAGIPASEFTDFEKVKFTSFRERPGDDASCLNLYAPQEPRVLGAPHEFLTAGRFSFQKVSSSNPEQQRNPWLLLESSNEDGTIPAIADANTIQYILHLSIGSELTIRGSDGKPVRLRLVAALKGSIFQGELLISEANFLRIFPEQSGYRFFLMDIPGGYDPELPQNLKERLSDWGFNLESSEERLAAYHRVENTYLSTFQSLGSLGLILGTIGLATILLRNTLERRKELALLRAVGYQKRVLMGIILTENVLLMIWGLASGTICAFLAIMPAIHSRGGNIPFTVTALILTGVLLTGLLSSTIAVVAAFRPPLLASLRSE